MRREDKKLYDAAMDGEMEDAKRALAAGANVNMADEGGDTPLIMASTYGTQEMVEFLLDNGANVNAKNLNGKTALDWARSEEKRVVLRDAISGQLPAAKAKANRIAAEKKKAEQERIVAEENKKAEEARIAAEQKKIEDDLLAAEILKTEDARRAAEEKKTEEDRIAAGATIEAALKRGSKPWLHARVMLVGEGRAGKTAVANSIMGKGYEDTHSTVGIHQSLCSIQYANNNTSEMSWEVDERPEKAYEAALAALMGGRAANYAIDEAVSVTTDMAQDRAKRGITLDGAPAAVEETLGSDSENNLLTNAKTSSEPALALAASSESTDHLINSTDSSRSASAPILPQNGSEVNVGVAQTRMEEIAVDNAVDENMVMKLLGGSKLKSTDITLSLFDYGGQSVFNVIHHLFLTPSGVYVLVFNMETLLAGEAERQRSLSYMRFWLNSIIIHAFDNTTGVTAPIFIVGTRKDKIPDPEKHAEISTLIHDSFKGCRAWPSVVTNRNGTSNRAKTILYFFPVDNTRHRNDPMMVEMMKEIEEKLKISRYTNKLVPLTWFKCLDVITSMKKSCLSLSEVIRIARACGLPDDEEVHYFLFFLNEMGTLMWHDEPTLRDIVILDPVEYLINPATIVICKHSPDGSDPTCHELPVHKECQAKCFEDWPLLYENGVVTEKMLDVLWKALTAEHQVILKALCLKFGLFVPLYEGTMSEKKYHVPALLRPCSLDALNNNSIRASLHLNTVFLVFSPFSNLDKRCRVITCADLRKYSFLAGGLFERIIGKAIVWTQTTSGSDYNIHDATVYKDFAILQFGNISFSLRLLVDAGCIRVDIDSVSPHVVEARLTELVQQVLSASMKSLSCYSTVFYEASGTHREAAYESFFSDGSADSYLIPLAIVDNIITKKGALNIKKTNRLISEAEAKDRFGVWFPDPVSDAYDVFISHRWDDEDDIVVAGLYESFSTHTVAALGNKQLQVFLDKRCLQAGEIFDKAFAKALCNSTVVAAVVSVKALERMVHHDPSKVDNVLLEWVLALSCCNAAESRVRAVFPILIGEREFSGDMICNAVHSLFSSDVYNALSTEVPTATLKLAVDLLERNGISIPDISAFHSRTLSSIVKDELGKFLGCLAWNFSPHRFISSAADEATAVLNKKMNDGGAAPSEPAPPICSPPPTVPDNFAVVVTDSKSNIQRAWELVQGGNIAENSEDLTAFLSQVGAEDMDAFSFLVEDVDLLEQLVGLLKPLRRKQIVSLLKSPER